MAVPHAVALGRRAFLAVSSALLGCGRRSASRATASASASASAPASASASPAPAPIARSTYPLFDAYPALGTSLNRQVLGAFPSRIDHATSLVPDGRLWIKRDDDFTLDGAATDPESASLARLFGGGKIRKLELHLGEARAIGKKRLITVVGVGSNQAAAVAVLGQALGFAVRLFLVPQPASSLNAKNLATDAGAHAELRFFATTADAEAEARRDLEAYFIPAGATGPLGTLGFVDAGLELALDVREQRMPAPRRIYIALGLGGSAAGLGLGCALGGLRGIEIVAIRASSPGAVGPATLKRIRHETSVFARARDPRFAIEPAGDENVRIDGRFLGAGYGSPTAAGQLAIDRAERDERWSLDPVYTGKAMAALLSDLEDGVEGPLLFWNTMSSRPTAAAAIPASFERWAR